MDEPLERIIRQALKDASAKGQDYLTQTQLAVRVVREIRSNMTASDALAAVNWICRT